MHKHISIALASLFFFTSNAFAVATPAFYKCTNKEGGEWNYGRVPNVCSANAFGSDTVLTRDYPLLIFIDTVSRTPERNRYMTEMTALIREAGEYYLKKRKPTVSADELKQWKFALQVVAAQESRMSHYRRTTDSRYKMIRGDSGHGHGMMQIDDRAHRTAIDSGTAWRLITNLTYAMDIYFREWERAPAQSCYKSATDKWKARIRSAWAAYNGGPGSICRWANPNSAWAANDRGFLDMYNNQSWNSYVLNQNATASVNVSCLIENKENCAKPGTDTSLSEGRLYQHPDQSVCAVLGGKFRCVKEQRDAICLKALGNVSVTSITAVSSSVAASLSKTVEDRHELCEDYDSTLIAVGDHLKTAMAINLRSTPGGGLITLLAKDLVLEVLDFEIRNSPVNDRYYKVKSGNNTGYIYAGDVGDHAAWAIPSSAPVNIPASVIRPGQRLTIVAPAGINQRSTPGGTLIRLIPKNTKLVVDNFVIQGANNEVYYFVNYLGKKGYIYSGSLLPSDSTSIWTKKTP